MALPGPRAPLQTVFGDHACYSCFKPLCQQGWEVGINQTPTVSVPADTGPPLFEILITKDRGTAQQLTLVPVRQRTAPALDPGGGTTKTPVAQGGDEPPQALLGGTIDVTPLDTEMVRLCLSWGEA